MSLCRRPIRRIALAAKTGSFINRIPLRSVSHQNIPRQLEQTNPGTQQPQYVGEERREDAVFKVYLKRIRHKSTNAVDSLSTESRQAADNLEQNEGTGEFQQDGDRSGTLLYSTIKVYQLKAGTLEKLVEHLTNEEGELDSMHMEILFSSYRTFTNIRTLIEKIIERYRAISPASLDMTEDVRQLSLKSLRRAMRHLLNNYKKDFDDPPRYSTLIYLSHHFPERDIQKQCEMLLEQFKRDEDQISSSVDRNNNSSSSTDYLYHHRGFDYVAPWNLMDMPSTLVAEQLTFVDADLLKRVLPYECLTMSSAGGSRRGSPNNGQRTLSTVHKTIEQFNAVVARVVATILKETDEQLRARVIEKWIDIAYECRLLKNFSSLTAILNGLLSGCIYRLNTAWSHVSGEKRSVLEQLKDIFGSCGDKQQARAILDKQLEEVRLASLNLNEATAKHVENNAPMSASLGRKFRHKKENEQQKQEMVGTVPYLGLYLSDLTYIDSAYPNTITVESSKDPTSTLKLIHFEKHRKEFEILAQIKLFQSAANSYTIHSLPRFKAWFDHVRTYTDAESWELSYQFEPKETVDNNQPYDLPPRAPTSQPLKALPRYPSQLSLESLLTTNSQGISIPTVTFDGSLRSSPSSTSLDKLSTNSVNSFVRFHFPSPQIKSEKKRQSNHSRSSSASSFLTSSNGSSSQGYISNTGSPTISSGNSTLNTTENDTVIAKVNLDGRNDLLYKKIRIGNNERTTGVLKTILDKFGIEPSFYDRYCIEQRIPGRTILIPDQCNVFYALARPSGDDQVDLFVREKTRQEREQNKSGGSTDGFGHNRTPSGLSVSSAHSR